MIIVKIFGGLGNQLFQYGFGLYLADVLNTKVVFDVQTIRNEKSFTKRNLELSVFDIHLDLASGSDVKIVKKFNKGILERIERKLVQKCPFLFRHYYVESSARKHIINTYLRDDCYYDGYWQSEIYLKAIEHILRPKFVIKQALDLLNANMLKNIISSNAVSLHIRRGDYLSIQSNTQIFNECTLYYYMNAVNLIREKVLNPTFYIFSDDIEWARAHFIGQEYIFVDFNTNSPGNDMFLMSHCRHHIISNSTFSWWGAWINNHQDKMVITPEKWFKNGMSEVGLLPESWIKLSI